MAVLKLILSAILPTLLHAMPTFVGITGLRPVGAGVGGPVGKIYKEDFTICPRDYPNSFNIECVTAGDVESVKITFGDLKPHTENQEPYFAFGNDGDNVKPSKVVPDAAVVDCQPKNGVAMKLKIMFECGKGKDGRDPEFTDEPEISGSPDVAETPEEEPTKPDTPPESSSPAPSASPPAAPSPEEPRPEEPSPAAPTEKCIGVEKDGRIVMDARGAGVVGGWVLKDDGIEYKPGGGGGIEDPGTDVLSFEFVPETTSRYLFTFEVTAPDRTEHNDAFVRFPRGGFTAMKPGENLKMDPESFLKAYNNAKARSVGAFHVDNDPHTLVTTETLKAGEKVTVELGARSTRFTIHNIILFPCDGDACLRGTSSYEAKIQNIKPTGCS